MLRLPGKSAAGLNFGFSEAAHTVCEGEQFPASTLGPQGAGMPVLPAGQRLVAGSGKEWTGLPLGPAVMLPGPQPVVLGPPEPPRKAADPSG